MEPYASTSKENDEEEINFENPNFRKLKATLKVKTTVSNLTSDDETFKQLEKDMNLIEIDEQLKNLEKKIQTQGDKLPKDWEKYEDDQGAYYWHIPSGTIQRDFPIENASFVNKRNSLIYYEDEVGEVNESSKLLESFDKISNEKSFIVNSLGSMDFDESQLSANLSSKAIQRCIIELTTKGDNNAVRCWGKDYAKKLVLKIENSCIKLYDIPTKKVLQVQPISSIKVWGVNGNNDFAYVAAESTIKQTYRQDDNSNENSPQISPMKTQSNLKCHIFHCPESIDNKEISDAQYIADLLKEEVIKFKTDQDENERLMEEYDASSTSSANFDLNEEEEIKTVVANYLGKIKVKKPVGIDIINKAINTVYNEQNEPIVCLIHISSLNIIVENVNTSEHVVKNHISRLSFLGISQNNIKQSAFILQNSKNEFEAFVFDCLPSSVTLCNYIQDACKSRYLKCLEAQKEHCENSIAIINKDSKTTEIKKKIANAFSKILSK